MVSPEYVEELLTCAYHMQTFENNSILFWDGIIRCREELATDQSTTLILCSRPPSYTHGMPQRFAAAWSACPRLAQKGEKGDDLGSARSCLCVNMLKTSNYYYAALKPLEA